MDTRKIIKKWLKEEKEKGCYVEFYDDEDDLDMITVDGFLDFDKLIKILDKQ